MGGNSNPYYINLLKLTSALVRKSIGLVLDFFLEVFGQDEVGID